MLRALLVLLSTTSWMCLDWTARSAGHNEVSVTTNNIRVLLFWYRYCYNNSVCSSWRLSLREEIQAGHFSNCLNEWCWSAGPLLVPGSWLGHWIIVTMVVVVVVVWGVGVWGCWDSQWQHSPPPLSPSPPPPTSSQHRIKLLLLNSTADQNCLQLFQSIKSKITFSETSLIIIILYGDKIGFYSN